MRRALIIAALSLLGACAQLRVDVDVIEPRYASAAALDAGLRVEAANIATSPHGLSDSFLSLAFTSYYRFRNSCADELIALATQARDAAARGSDAWLIQDENINVLTRAKSNHRSQEEATTALYALDMDVVRAIRADPSEAADTRTPSALSGGLRSALMARRAEIARIETQLREYVRSQSDGSFSCHEQAEKATRDQPADAARATQAEANQAAQKPAAEAAIHAAAERTTITGNGVLLNNHLEAFYITNAPDRVWARRYNRAFGGGMFGSTSIAIVMNETADFSVKGFIFDGRSVAQMVSKVGVQAIATIAAAHGAPINLRGTPAVGTTPTGSPTTFDPTGLISTNRATVERAEAEEEAYQTALLRIAETVMGNWDNLARATQNAAVRTIVSDTVTAYRSSWQTPPPAPRQ